MSRPPKEVSAYLAGIGAKGGKAGKGSKKKRGGSKYYRDLINKRWAGKPRAVPKKRVRRKRLPDTAPVKPPVPAQVPTPAAKSKLAERKDKWQP